MNLLTSTEQMSRIADELMLMLMFDADLDADADDAQMSRLADEQMNK